MKKTFWKNSHIKKFWGEVAPLNHLVQVYDDDYAFLNTLEGFAGTGLVAGESVIIIATKEHIAALDERLRTHRFSIDQLREQDLYITMDADELLDKILMNNWPDEQAFFSVITELIVRARGHGSRRKIRAFGELVGLLWERGHTSAVIYLENLWNRLHNNRDFTLFCAYPKSGFMNSPHDAIATICKSHTKIIDGAVRPSSEIYYK